MNAREILELGTRFDLLLKEPASPEECWFCFRFENIVR